MASVPIRVNRAPVLTLWAAIVAERLGHPPATALSLASALAGTAAQAKARRIGLATGTEPTPGRPGRTERLLGRDIPVTESDGVVLAADAGGLPARPEPVEAYVTRAFGPSLPEVRAAMAALTERVPPEELNRIGFRLYEAFRPEVPDGVAGWGAKSVLRLDRIRDAVP